MADVAPEIADQTAPVALKRNLMSDSNMTTVSSISRSFATPALTLLAFGALSSSAQAVALHIDPQLSRVTYSAGGFLTCDPEGNCGTFPETQTFALSGSFDLRQETVHVTTSHFPPDGYEREQIRFESIAVDSGGAKVLGFVFPAYFAVLTGRDFEANEDPCSWFPALGTCWSMGAFGSYSGRFDGTTLSMSGTDYAGDAFPSTFRFNVVARVADAASVSEPGTLACLAMGVLGLGVARRRRDGRHGRFGSNSGLPMSV